MNNIKTLKETLKEAKEDFKKSLDKIKNKNEIAKQKAKIRSEKIKSFQIKCMKGLGTSILSLLTITILLPLSIWLLILCLAGLSSLI